MKCSISPLPHLDVFLSVTVSHFHLFRGNILLFIPLSLIFGCTEKVPRPPKGPCTAILLQPHVSLKGPFRY